MATGAEVEIAQQSLEMGALVGGEATIGCDSQIGGALCDGVVRVEIAGDVIKEQEKSRRGWWFCTGRTDE